MNATATTPTTGSGKFNLILSKAQVRFDWPKDKHWRVICALHKLSYKLAIYLKEIEEHSTQAIKSMHYGDLWLVNESIIEREEKEVLQNKAATKCTTGESLDQRLKFKWVLLHANMQDTHCKLLLAMLQMADTI